MPDVPLIERIRGTRIETGANRPFPMDDPTRVHFVERGHLDVFAVEMKDDEIVGRRRFVARVPAGEMAFGSERIEDPEGHDETFGFLAVPSLSAVIVQGEREGVASESFDLAATNWIDHWISRLSEFLVRDRPPPRNALLLEADPDVPYPSGSALSAQHMDVIWVSANTPMRLAGRDTLVVAEGEPLLPLTEQTWFEIGSDAEVSAIYTPTALLTERLWPGFDRFSAIVLEFAVLSEAEAEATAEERRRSAHEARRASLSGALRGFWGVLGVGNRGPVDAGGHTPLQTAAALVASSCGATLDFPPRLKDNRHPLAAVEAIARGSGIRTRWISLSPRWWRRDGPSFVGFTAGEEGQERALGILADNRGAYRAVDPETGASFPVNDKTASGIKPGGLTFYAPLPDHIESGKEALRFSMHRRGGDLRAMLAVGIMGGLAALLTPVLTGEMLVRIIPRGDIPLWLAALGALLFVAFGNAVFEIVRGIALLRMEGRLDERLQAAIWNRLVSLPASFFRRFTAGDLENRANGIAEIRQMMTGAAVQAAMGGIFSIFSLGLLFYYSWSLALGVCGLLLVLAGATWTLSLGQLRHSRAVFHAQGKINGLVFQMISGLAKLRVANSESYALARWAQGFAGQKRESLAALRWAAGQHVVSGMFQPLALIAIFASVNYALMHGGNPSFDLAAFLSFNAAFGQLTGAVIGLTAAATTVIGIIPLLERVQPILRARPESRAGGIDPGDLKGEIEFANVSFRYSPENPTVLNGVSFHIKQGDYVAFVGPSGCGKSTIYRLLLGFEEPDSGTVFLDGHDLSSLDLNAVRDPMGAVLQNGEVVAGSIFENIAGLSPLSAEEAWAAARAAALEEDIRAMPMGMRTVLPEGGTGLSVGQKQRLLIARALARKPRILLFDEATSALDNRAQAVVQASVKKLGITRLVIAHRLSSIRDVDRIYVLDGGRVVESGSFEQLIKRDGVFAALSRRQLVQG